MARTALELTSEELQEYHLSKRHKAEHVAERWDRAWKMANTAVGLLRKEYGATRVMVFGSLVDREWFTPWSDIDLIAWGIPASEFYRAVAVITGLSQEFKVDLVDPETCRPALLRWIEREGIDL